MYIFTHIPKTSGTSFDKCIVHNFKNVFFAHDKIEEYSLKTKSIYDIYLLKEKIKLKPDYVHAHLPYGIHNIFNVNLEDVRYITYLREPVGRTISSIRHVSKVMNKKGLVINGLFRTLKKKYKNNNNFLEQLLINNINCNQMTLQLSGLVDLENIELSNDLKNVGHFFSPYFKLKRKYSDLEMEEMLEAAINNLKTYEFIGFKKIFNKSLRSFARKFGMTIREAEYLKKTNIKYFKIDKKDKESINILKEMNKYDIRLYSYFFK